MATTKRNRTAWIVLFDIVVFTVYWYLIPAVKRPFEGLAVVVAVLGSLTALLARPPLLRGLAVTAVAIGVLVYGFEMVERKFRLVDRLYDTPPERVAGYRIAA